MKHISIDIETYKNVNKKANGIPIKRIKVNHFDVIYNDFNTILLDKGTFPDYLKDANVISVFKQDTRTDKKLQTS